MITVVLLDDQLLVRAGVRALLARTGQGAAAVTADPAGT
jgi:DNA-binding NarL/FixJ family response regulator